MNNKIINVDTDSILICKEDQSTWSKEEQKLFLDALNAQFPEKIKFDHDGIFETVLVVSSKNYALRPEGTNKIKIKGSSLKDQKREPAIKEMIDSIIKEFMFNEKQDVLSIYNKYVQEIMDIKDITRWSSKKTVTEAILNCRGAELRIETILQPDDPSKRIEKKVYYKNGKKTDIRSNEMVVWDAIKDEELIQSGDKVYVYPAILSSEIVRTEKTLKSGVVKATEKEIRKYGLHQPKNWDGKNHDKEHLLKRLYDTVSIFETVLDISQFKNYSLVKNYKELNGKVE